MKTLLILLFQFLIMFAHAQVRISGVVQSESGSPVTGVNIFIQGTYDGTTSDTLGVFSFTTDATGDQTLIASCVGFETYGQALNISGDISDITIILIEEISELDEVIINAGTFEASDKKKSVVLKPLDVALTAGANGDIFGAFGKLPGSQTVGEEGRLFVRGGESYETKTFMDGMLVNTPYYSKMPDLPTRGRFSPILFNGSVFSTGGYSAEYGQALSSIVALNTVALEPETKSSISFLSVGLQGSHAKRWENTSLSVSGEYLNTTLSNKLFKQNVDWLQEPVIIGSTMLFRHKTSETGMIKSFATFNYDTSSLLYENIEQSAFQKISMDNNNLYSNTTYNEMLNDEWMIQTGFAFNIDRENMDIDSDEIATARNSSQLKLTLSNYSIKDVTTTFGAEALIYKYDQDINMNGDFNLSFNNNLFAAFAESEWKVTKSFALKAGLRTEYNSLINELNAVPRLSAAVKTGKSSQLSAAYGKFFQNPGDDYLKFTDELAPETSSHSILTWQYKKDSRTLRIEAYNKNYSDLVKFDEEFSAEPGNYNNTGSGYSRGIDVFWRDQKEFGKDDYWISYSWIDSKRNYRDYPMKVTPHYVSKHNLSVVYKRYFTKINSFISGSYTFASGRPYDNPNTPEFMAGKTKTYNDVSFGFTHLFYLFNTQTVAHVIVNNALGFNNVFGYNYAQTPDNNGVYQSQAIVPGQKRLIVFLLSFQL
ncbi:TonB-dependent receptor [Draconibacterium sp. IB214405]|uniref:TonB-dependent receptor n=1 Tax=Draconibacterium sp. IB214405 TaxID=3097352 RepID=UPI002A0BC9C9|nr:TonB-dependent receptor [Draconibacterium sp. IB214405]MDX8339481.1 TonB-dependent receptor [Draconibacterium sp. IB214405]